MNKLLTTLILILLAMPMMAQRVTDKLDRGLIAMKVSSGVYVSWRLLGEEYYDVKFNLYRNGTKIAENLNVTNFTDKSGTASNTYTVAPVVKGVEQAQSKAVTPWASSYKEIKLAHKDIKSTLVPNDACCADVDGDGELEILMKFDNLTEMQQSYPKAGPTVNGVATGEYSIFEILKMDGTRLWWVNCGPNMGDFQNNEQNIVGYDWDQDGKAEVIMRLLEGSTIHMANGTTYTIGANGQNGTSWTNYRGATGGGTNWFMHDGKEFLVYCNGQTGEIFDLIDFPLARLESSGGDLNSQWGDGYGHRSNKFFYGAPYLDGRNPSIFLARGIYTRHKMAAYDVNKSTHKLSLRWKWYNNTNGPWKGQGYHNYSIADVDWDGRDEVVFGSMVIDDNGKGLSTTGFGHGDAHHVGDLNPYKHGQEIFACNEDEQGYNYRDATTSTTYKAILKVGSDIGRCMMDNFSDQWPGSIGTAYGDPISSVTNEPVSGMGSTGINSNFRIFWDGDLLSETFNYANGKNTAGIIAKYGSWSAIYTCQGSLTNNDTKGTPCYQGDLFGDWREEIIMRTADNNIRIYSTPTPTSYRMATLWSDHQYRNAMVWQMCGYNQPPHVSYFVGQLENITIAPPPLTMTGREEVANGGTVGASLNGKHAIVCETADSKVSIAEGAAPDVLTFNIPTWVQGTAASEATASKPTINYTSYTCDVSGSGITGAGRLVKQGDGILNLPKAAFTHTGSTDIWAGVVNFDGTMKQSPLWLNRFAELNSNGGEFKSIKADYGSVIRPGGKDTKGDITTDSLKLGFGSRIVVDIYADGFAADQVKTKYLSIEKKTGIWETAGPQYIKPVIEVAAHMASGQTMMPSGKYIIGEVATTEGSLVGDVNDIILEGLTMQSKSLSIEGGKIILEIKDTRDATEVTWTGAQSGVWDFGVSENFTMRDGAAVVPTAFVSGDKVLFDEAAKIKTVSVAGTLSPVAMEVNATSAYTFGGEGSIVGNASYIKEGTGTVTMSGNNSYTGGNYLKGGVTVVSSLAYDATHTSGNLGGLTTSADMFTMENGAVLQTTAAVTQGSPMKMIGEGGGVINNSADFTMAKSFSGTLLTKKGTGGLKLNATNSGLSKLSIVQGSISLGANSQPKAIELRAGTLYDNASNTTHSIIVPKGSTATWQLTGSNYVAYSNVLTGEGTLTIIPRNTVSRVRITGNWSNFYGTIKHTTSKIWLPLDMSTSASHATLNIAADCSVGNVPGRTLAIGAVTGAGVLTNVACDLQSQNAKTGNVTYNVGNSDGKDFEFEGIVRDQSSVNTVTFNKVGSCTMTTSGQWETIKPVAVKAGTLHVVKGSLGTGALTIDKGATFIGYSSTSSSPSVQMTNSSVTVNGTLCPAYDEESSSTLYKLYFSNKNVTVNEGGTLEFHINKAVDAASANSSVSCPTIMNVGTLTVNGDILLNLMPSSSWTPAVGDVIRLWNPEKIANFAGTPVVRAKAYNGKMFTFDASKIAQGIVSISGVSLYGDVNGDGKVDITDVTACISAICGIDTYKAAADVDMNGKIDYEDVQSIVSAICGK